MSCFFACGLLRCEKQNKTPLSLLKDGAEGGSPGGKNSVFDCLPKVLTVFSHPFFWGFTCTIHPSIHPSLPVCARVCVGVIYWCVMIKKNKSISMDGTEFDRVPTLQHGAEAGGHRPMTVATWEEYIMYIVARSKARGRKKSHVCLPPPSSHDADRLGVWNEKEGKKKERGERKRKGQHI